MIVFAHIKFGLVRIQGSGVKKGGGGGESAPRLERVFQIPVQIGLKKVSDMKFISIFLPLGES